MSEPDKEPMLGDRNEQRKIVDELNIPSVNPFMTRTPDFTPYEMVKFVIGLFTLVPLRIILVVISLILLVTVSKISISGLSDEDLKNPLPPSRRRILSLNRYFARFLLFSLGVAWISTKGKPDPKARIITPNHVSLFDAFYMFYACQSSFVAKKEVASTPLLGDLFRSLQPILVDRRSSSSRSDTANEIERRAKWEGPDEWGPIVIFPEGTTSNGTALISFKFGAFRAGTPVQPVVLRYPFVNFDVGFVNGISGTMLVLRTLCQFVNHMEVEFLPVHYPTEKEKADAALFAHNVRAEMSDALNVPVTDHTYEDVLLQLEAMKRSVPPKKVILTKSLRSHFGDQSYETLNTQLKEFAHADHLGRGNLDIEQFRTALGLPDSKYVTELFNMLDVTESGTIDFREYIAGRALISQHLSTEESLKMVFSAFDVNNDGVIEAGELLGAMKIAFPDISEESVQDLFNSIDRSLPDRVNFEEFSSHLRKHPEYYGLFLAFKRDSSESKKDQ